MHHLLAGCVLSRITCFEILAWCRSTAGPPDGTASFFDWWSATIEASPASHRKGLGSLIALMAWAIWRHRNACVFDKKLPSTTSLVSSIKDDARRWVKAGVGGMESIIPAN